MANILNGGSLMKKRFLALFCVLTLLLGAVPSAAALEGESRRAAETLASLGLIASVPSQEALEAPATRLQSTELLVRFAGVTSATREVSVQEYAVSQGWVTVTGGQHEAVPSSEFCAALLRQLGYEGFTEETAGLFARRIALTTRDYAETLSLGDLYQLVRDALAFPNREGVPAVRKLEEAGLCTQAQAQALFPEELTARQVADRHMAAVFRLDTYYTEEAYENDVRSNGGSGFFISSDGLAVTNYHTIDSAVRATANLITGECFEVERVLFYDTEADLALLRVSRTTRDQKTTVPSFSFLELAEDPALRRGDPVYTLGVPLGLTLAISDGIVSATDHEVEGYTFPCVINTADISHGSSGGVLMNVYGRVVGVTTGAYSAGNNLYISVPLIPILSADWTAEGVTLAEVAEEARGSR